MECIIKSLGVIMARHVTALAHHSAHVGFQTDSATWHWTDNYKSVCLRPSLFFGGSSDEVWRFWVSIFKDLVPALFFTISIVLHPCHLRPWQGIDALLQTTHTHTDTHRVHRLALTPSAITLSLTPFPLFWFRFFQLIKNGKYSTCMARWVWLRELNWSCWQHFALQPWDGGGEKLKPGCLQAATQMDLCQCKSCRDNRSSWGSEGPTGSKRAVTTLLFWHCLWYMFVQ